MSPRIPKFVWAKLNAYGIVLAGLALLGFVDLYHPQNAQLARLVGEVPPGQVFWVTGFGIAGLLLLYGFIKHDRLAESLALVILCVSLAFQTVVAYSLIGFSDFTLTRVLVLLLFVFAGSARISVLWSKDGLIVTIPARKVKK